VPFVAPPSPDCRKIAIFHTEAVILNISNCPKVRVSHHLPMFYVGRRAIHSKEKKTLSTDSISRWGSAGL